MSDDAIHVRSPISKPMTLCGAEAHRVLNLREYDEPLPDSIAGCWTCIDRARNLRLYAPASTPTQEPA